MQMILDITFVSNYINFIEVQHIDDKSFSFEIMNKNLIKMEQNVGMLARVSCILYGYN